VSIPCVTLRGIAYKFLLESYTDPGLARRDGIAMELLRHAIVTSEIAHNDTQSSQYSAPSLAD